MFKHKNVYKLDKKVEKVITQVREVYHRVWDVNYV